jgi:hypothetical protein
MQDEPVMGGFQVFLRHESQQTGFDRLGCFAGRELHAVGHAEDVRIAS